MKLLYDNVLIIPDEEEEEKTTSGIYLGTMKKPPTTGIVACTGEGTFEYGKWIHNEVEIGDYVQFKGDYEPMTIEGKPYLLMKQTNIICIL